MADLGEARAAELRAALAPRPARRAEVEPIPKPQPKGPAQRQRLKPRSPRKRDRYAEIAAACASAIERDRSCQARILVPEIRCWGPLDPQHLIPQGVRKDLAAEPENIVACCRGHHDWIGDHPLRARELGLHGRAGDDLAELARRRSLAPPR